MAFSLGIIIILGLIFNTIFEKFKLPGLLGLLILGVLIGPYGVGLLGKDILSSSGDLRKIALIVILLRAGLGIKKEDLKENGISALKMSFIPGVVEGFTIAFMSVKLLNFSFIQGGILGFIIAAVSPAVLVPSMLKMIKQGLGKEKAIPTLIIAGASIDDVFAITIFGAFLSLYSGGDKYIGLQLLNIPVSIILGVLLGVIFAFILVHIFKRYNLTDTKKILIVLGISILFTEVEKLLKPSIEIASLLGVMTIGFIISEKLPRIGKELSNGFNKIWTFAQMLLFILVGAEVNVSIALKAGKIGIIILAMGLIGRSTGVIISLMGSNLNLKEKLFCIISYTPKATVQAAIGAIPLTLGVEGGEVILAIAVLSIIITAPLGAIGINYFGEKLLKNK
ncbi:cation:proton antiporter domain-containing protein [Tissierella creatinophila]|uniref:K(+)/H(+) antiporter NhaP2 n=1 Tax=Tissierella creatinophila DSM 6911 TaxID=1123403 RepID=A0A1U7M701_TISCR|nr:cation:proton antiporter [Tissierella creatinophila]OLS03077.1 K(+)/H(+) antiporter NhaP2 [Tissierella creatinophila DSM 6911]